MPSPLLRGLGRSQGSKPGVQHVYEDINLRELGHIGIHDRRNNAIDVINEETLSGHSSIFRLLHGPFTPLVQCFGEK